MRFLSCDWGTSSLRLRLVATSPVRVEAEIASDDGAARIHTAALQAAPARGGKSDRASEEERARRFEARLIERLDELERRSGASIAGLPVVVSGMASSSIGWRELPYGSVPLELDGAGLPTARLAPIGAGRHPVVLVSGLRARTDIMRGEEVEALGVLHAKAYRGIESTLLILPGTHSKHIRVVDRKLTAFETFMTGELYEVMARHSILQSSVDPSALFGRWWEATPALVEAYRSGVSSSRDRPLSGSLFSVRAHDVLQGESPGWCAAHLSGLLIGAELVDAAQNVVTGTPILLGATGPLRFPYRLACAVLGLEDGITFVAEETMDLAVVSGQQLLLERSV